MAIFLLCLKIFFCRIVDVSLGTMRTILIVKDKILYAAIVSFAEVFIWFIIVREALNTANTSIFVALAYAGGYASGCVIGGLLMRAITHSTVSVQVITTTRNKDILVKLREAGYPMTVVDAYGQNHEMEKYLLNIEIDGKDLEALKRTILSLDPKAFVKVNDIKQVSNGYFRRHSK